MMRGAFLAQIPSVQLRLKATRKVKLNATAPSSTDATYKRDLSALMEVLEEDSPNLFSEQGMCECLMFTKAADVTRLQIMSSLELCVEIC